MLRPASVSTTDVAIENEQLRPVLNRPNTAVDLTGKLAIVTGGNRGIGRAIAERFLDHGADVHVIDIDGSHFEEIKRYGEQRHCRCSYTVADVTDESSVHQLVKELGSEFGKIDVLINNAGIFHASSIVDFPRESWDRQFAVNVTGPFIVSQAVLPFMPRNAGAAIVNIASVAGKTGAAFAAGYIASKHAIVGLTRALALELAPLGINVNAVAPGFVNTDLLKQILSELAPLAGHTGPEETLRTLLADIPQSRLIQPREVANLAVHLASDESKSITGQIMNVAGGWLQY